MFTVSSSFIAKFKIGDNINHNLRVLALLYQYFGERQEEEKRLLCKPITVTLISIVEAMLYDFHLRCRDFTQEGISALPETTLAYIRQLGRIDEFGTCIASAKRHDLFADGNNTFYDALEELRKLRNRIHIQNTKALFEPNEWDAFDLRRKIEAERALEKVAKTLAKKYPRAEHVAGYVGDFQMPWDEHFREQVRRRG